MDRDELRERLIEAELETGEHETSIEAAQRNVFIRALRISAGAFITILGIILMPLPGPGALVVAAGLVILSRDVAWADRALRKLRKYSPGIPEDGSIPRSTMVVGGLLMVAGGLAAYWFNTQIL